MKITREAGKSKKIFSLHFQVINSELNLSTLLQRAEKLLYLEHNKESWFFLKRGINKTKALQQLYVLQG